MIGPVILSLDDAVSAVASASHLLPAAASSTEQKSFAKHVHVYDIVRNDAGTLIAGHVSHASHASHVSSYGGGGGGGGGDSYAPPVYAPPVHHAPTAPATVDATPGDRTATVSWSPVSTDDGGSVTYTVSVSPGGLTKTVVGATTAQFEGLTNGVAYSFVVVAANSVGSSPASVASGTIVPVAPQLAAHVPIIVGKPAAGQTLHVETPGWDSGTVFTYQWHVDGVDIPGATADGLLLPKNFMGKRITVTASGANVAFAEGASATSAPTKKIARIGTPRIVGKPKVGTTLHAHGDPWTPGTKLTFTWYVDGKKVKNDHGSALLLNEHHVGKTVTVKVTGSKSGYATLHTVSGPTGKVKG